MNNLSIININEIRDAQNYLIDILKTLEQYPDELTTIIQYFEEIKNEITSIDISGSIDTKDFTFYHNHPVRCFHFSISVNFAHEE